jgi:hypothetical protein
VVIATTQDYRRLSGDRDSYDGDVMLALADAQDEFLRRTGRKIELGTYTEVLPVYEDGRVYPAATPVASVLDPAEASHDEFSIVIAAAFDTLAFGDSSWPGTYPAYGAYGGYQPFPADVLVGTDRRPPPEAAHRRLHRRLRPGAAGRDALRVRDGQPRAASGLRLRPACGHHLGDPR